jgi:hypothetical protein
LSQTTRVIKKKKKTRRDSIHKNRKSHRRNTKTYPSPLFFSKTTTVQQI